MLASCLGVDTAAEFSADGSVSCTITYTVSNAVLELGALGANESLLPLPVGQDDLALAATRAGGQLGSWKRADGAENAVIVATLRFPDAAAFARFLDPSGTKATVTINGNTTELRMELFPGGAPADPDIDDFVRAAFGEYTVSFSITAPRTIQTTDGFKAIVNRAT